MGDKDYQICDAAALESVIGEPMDIARQKVTTQINDAMKAFIAASPLAMVSTIDENGRVDVSPKGDPAGFVQVDGNGDLLIPERPGNRLTFGFHNILRNREIGLLFLAPHQRETLRIKGTATLHRDPDVLDSMSVNGRPALLYTRVEVNECFFHCGKALIRSNLWQPDHWPEKTGSIVSVYRLIGKEARNAEEERKAEAALERTYTDELY